MSSNFNIPVPLFGELFTNRQDFCSSVCEAALIRSTIESNTTTTKAVGQVLFDYGFTGDLPGDLKLAIDEMVNLDFLCVEMIESWLDSETGKWCPDNKMMLEIIDTLSNEVFWPYNYDSFALRIEDFRLFGKLKIELHRLGFFADAVALYGQFDTLLDKYEPTFDAPFALLPSDAFFRVKDELPNFDDTDTALFAAYLSTLSIIGNKPFALTTTDQIIARMIGKATKAEVSELLAADDLLANVYRTWSSRRRSAALLEMMREQYGLRRIDANRAIALSFSLNEDEMRKQMATNSYCRTRASCVQ